MKNLCEFAESILARNTIETFIEIICSLSDDDVKQIIAGWKFWMIESG